MFPSSVISLVSLMRRCCGHRSSLREDRVYLATSLVEHGDSLIDLFRVSGVADLRGRLRESHPGLRERGHARTVLGALRFPRGGLICCGLGQLPSGIREGVGLASVGFLCADETLVREQLKCRVHRAWAGLPRAATAFLDLVDDLVAVHGILDEEGKHRRAHVAPSHSRTDLALELSAQLAQRVPHRGARPALTVAASASREHIAHKRTTHDVLLQRRNHHGFDDTQRYIVGLCNCQAGTRWYPRLVTHQLTRDQARRIAVRAQLLDADRPGDVVEVAEELGAVKIDPTATIAPAEHSILWSRIGAAYDPIQLSKAAELDRLLFEFDGAFR